MDGLVDDVAFWKEHLTDVSLDTLYASGSGKFFAAIWDAIFSGPRLARSDKPEIKRVP